MTAVWPIKSFYVHISVFNVIKTIKIVLYVIQCNLNSEVLFTGNHYVKKKQVFRHGMQFNIQYIYK